MKISIENFESERLIYRDLEKNDAALLLKIYSNKEAMKYRDSPPMQKIKDAEDFIIIQVHEDPECLNIRKGVELKSEKKLIGSVLFIYDKERPKECEIGYSIDQEYWGKGLGKEIVGALKKEIMDQEGIEMIKANFRKENLASQKILEANGFIPVTQNEIQGKELYIFNISKPC